VSPCHSTTRIIAARSVRRRSIAPKRELQRLRQPPRAPPGPGRWCSGEGSSDPDSRRAPDDGRWRRGKSPSDSDNRRAPPGAGRWLRSEDPGNSDRSRAPRPAPVDPPLVQTKRNSGSHVDEDSISLVKRRLSRVSADLRKCEQKDQHAGEGADASTGQWAHGPVRWG